MPIDVVIIRAFKQDGTLAMHQVYSNERWYDEGDGIPLIDDEPAVVAYYKVRVIRGEQYHTDGSLVKRWIQRYAEDGTVLELVQWHDDGSVTAWRMMQGNLEPLTDIPDEYSEYSE